MANATDEKLREAVRRLAPQLILDQTRRGIPRHRGIGRPRRVAARDGADLDLDGSMDAIVGARSEGRMPALDEMTAVEWARPDLAICLVIDQSGSMNGDRLTTAAVAAAACLTFAPEEHAVVAFASTPVTLLGLGGADEGATTIAQVLRLRGHGTTGLSSALLAAGEQLRGARARRRLTLLLSDCRATDEVDAAPAARMLDELVIVAPVGDDDEARRLARETGARSASVGSVLDLPRALNQLLGEDDT